MDPAVVVCPGLRPQVAGGIRLYVFACVTLGHNYAAEPFTTIGAERVSLGVLLLLTKFPEMAKPGPERDGDNGPVAFSKSARHLRRWCLMRVGHALASSCPCAERA